MEGRPRPSELEADGSEPGGLSGEATQASEDERDVSSLSNERTHNGQRAFL